MLRILFFIIGYAMLALAAAVLYMHFVLKMPYDTAISKVGDAVVHVIKSKDVQQPVQAVGNQVKKISNAVQ